MTLKPRSCIFLNTSNLGYFPLTQHHTLVSLVTKPSSLITWTYHEVETAVVYHMQKVSRKSSWQANGTWLFRSFQLKKLLWATEFLKRKGNVFVFQMFQAEIRVPFHRSHLWYQFQAFVAVFWENGFDLCKWSTRLKDEICQSWILLTICPNRESISVCPCILVNNSPRFVLSPSAESPVIDGKQHIYTMAQSVSGIVFLFIDHYPSQKYMTIKIGEGLNWNTAFVHSHRPK